MPAKHPSPEQVEAGEERAKQRDPHGAKPAEESRDHEPKGHPTSDRHDTETAVKKDQS